MNLSRKYAAAAAVASAALAIPAAARADVPASSLPPGATTLPAGATTLPAGATTLPAGATTLPGVSLKFVPPSVGPITVDLGATIINGKVMAPPVHVGVPGVKLAPITWTWPPSDD
jgi:hypothetical protein